MEELKPLRLGFAAVCFSQLTVPCLLAAVPPRLQYRLGPQYPPGTPPSPPGPLFPERRAARPTPASSESSRTSPCGQRRAAGLAEGGIVACWQQAGSTRAGWCTHGCRNPNTQPPEPHQSSTAAACRTCLWCRRPPPRRLRGGCQCRCTAHCRWAAQRWWEVRHD